MAALFALGLMAKPVLVTLPLVLLLLDYWPFGHMTPLTGRVIFEKLPLLLLTALSCVATMWAQARRSGVYRAPSLVVADKQRPGLVRRLRGAVVLAAGTGRVLSPPWIRVCRSGRSSVPRWC